MKRCCFSGFIILLGIFLSQAGVTATYDATGEWNATVSGHWNNCGESNPGTERYAGVIVQNGNRFTLIILMDESTVTGTISGAIYTTSDSYYEDGGWVNETCAVAAKSNSQASGPCNWTWSGSGESCNGGYNISMTKEAQNPPAYDATGSWDYSTSSHSNTCGDPPENSSSGTADITQTQNKVTMVDDRQVQYDGFVSGPSYTFVRSYSEEGGTTSEVYTLNLGAGGTSGSGTCTWVWNDPYDSCNGGFNISIAKPQVYIITASAGPGGSISPSGLVSVEHGAAQHFGFTPDPGYRVESILYDEILYETRNWAGAYIENVVADHTFKVLFERIGLLPGIPLLLFDD